MVNWSSKLLTEATHVPAASYWFHHITFYPSQSIHVGFWPYVLPTLVMFYPACTIHSRWIFSQCFPNAHPTEPAHVPAASYWIHSHHQILLTQCPSTFYPSKSIHVWFLPNELTVIHVSYPIHSFPILFQVGIQHSPTLNPLMCDPDTSSMH